MTDETFEVEAGVEMPARRSRSSKYPFMQMDVGDSFGIQADAISRVRGAVANFVKSHEAKFSVRTLEDGTARVWRLK